MLTVLNMLSKDQECLFPLVWADEHDGIYNSFSESDISIFLETIGQEFEKSSCFLWNSLE
jgi:hypothetical protein